MIDLDCIVINFSYPTTQQVLYYQGPWQFKRYAVGVQVLPIVLVLPANVAIGDRFHIEYHFCSAVGRVGPKMRTHVDILA